MTVAWSRLWSVQIVQGSLVSILPQIVQTVTLASASAIALAKGESRLLAALDEMQGGTPGRAGTEPRQFGEQLDQPLDLGARDGFSHVMPVRA